MSKCYGDHIGRRKSPADRFQFANSREQCGVGNAAATRNEVQTMGEKLRFLRGNADFAADQFPNIVCLRNPKPEQNGNVREGGHTDGNKYCPNPFEKISATNELFPGPCRKIAENAREKT